MRSTRGSLLCILTVIALLIGLPGCIVTIGGRKEVVEIRSTPLSPGSIDGVRTTALPPPVVPMLEALFNGLFKFWGKSREMKEETHQKGIELDRPVKREEEFYLLKVEK